MDGITQERARIRALVVARMNLFREYQQEYEDTGDDDSAHAWVLAQKGMRGLLNEIDNGTSVADFPKRRA